MNKKTAFALGAAALIALIVFAMRPSPPEAEASAKPKDPARTAASMPSMPFNPADFEPGEGVSERSIERLATRAAELKEARAQLSEKLQSIDKRLADPAQAANAAALREAKQALERSTLQMEMEEKALAEFLRNEAATPASSR